MSYFLVICACKRSITAKSPVRHENPRNRPKLPPAAAWKSIIFFLNNLERLRRFFSYYSYLIKVGSGLGEDACSAVALFNLFLLGCQSLRETLLQKYLKFDS